jgi:Ran GTPase-activating protein (RanGAP) involved in mRNA processing and transport
LGIQDLTTNSDISGIIALADVLPDLGAMTSLHVGTNKIPEKEMRELMAIAMSMDNMKILCEVPFKDKTITELDLSGKNLGIEGARVVAEYLDGNRALALLNLANNSLGELVLPEGWTKTGGGWDPTVFKHADGREQKEDPGSKREGIIAIANAMPDTRALVKLDISENYIGAGQERGLQRICAARGINLAK